ncbi:MAG: hypothetical protein IPL65_19285 [Lewinellaceae bacterium]|nr:hypothetical protein [Lewinellaceae bacterium]
MKNEILPFAFALCFQMIANAQEIEQPQVVAVVKIDRVYILMDETPVANLQVELRDDTGKIILEHSFNNDTEAWYFMLPALKAGKYHVTAKGVTLASFSRKAPTTVRLLQSK